MFGLGDQFEYLECKHCGCLSLLSCVADWSQYYPASYYSFYKEFVPSRYHALIDRVRARNTPLLAKLFDRVRPEPAIAALRPLKADQRMLDVGSGSGWLLSRLRDAGFRVVGIDPFLRSDVLDHSGGLLVSKGHLHDVAESFDVIYFNQSLEHIPDQLETLRLASRALTPRGRIVVRIPMANEAWKVYRDCWYQLDAPRHFFLHTDRSFGILAKKAGLSITSVRYESDERQFWYSELYRRGIPLKECEVIPVSHSTLKALRTEAKKLNRMNQGDRASFVLTADNGSGVPTEHIRKRCALYPFD